MRQLVSILGTPVDRLDTAQTLERLEQFIAERRFHQVATANADFVVKAASDPELRRILRDSDLVTADGMPLVWASKRMGAALPERVTGADIVPALAGLAAQKGYRLYMLGARPDIAQRAKARLEADYPGVQIVRCVSPPVAPLDKMDHEAILRDIEDARPDVLLVAFGNPKQEKWIAMHRNRLTVPICIGIGGTFDFLAGEIARAPEWMKRSGMEWAFRLSQEPKRLWKRYTTDIVHFARHYSRQSRSMRGMAETPKGQWTLTSSEGATVAAISGGLVQAYLPELQSLADETFRRGETLILDMTKVTALDSAVLGTLLNLPKRAAYAETDFRLAGCPPRIQKILRAALAEERLAVYPDVAAARNAAKQPNAAIVNRLSAYPDEKPATAVAPEAARR